MIMASCLDAAKSFFSYAFQGNSCVICYWRTVLVETAVSNGVLWHAFCMFNNAEQIGVPSTKRCIVCAACDLKPDGQDQPWRHDDLNTDVKCHDSKLSCASHSRRLGPSCQSSEIILVIFICQLKIVFKIGLNGFLRLFQFFISSEVSSESV